MFFGFVRLRLQTAALVADVRIAFSLVTFNGFILMHYRRLR